MQTARNFITSSLWYNLLQRDISKISQHIYVFHKSTMILKHHSANDSYHGYELSQSGGWPVVFLHHLPPLQQLTSCNDVYYTTIKNTSKYFHLLLFSCDWSHFSSSKPVFAAWFFLFSAKFCCAVISVSISESSSVIFASRIQSALCLWWLQGVGFLICFWF